MLWRQVDGLGEKDFVLRQEWRDYDQISAHLPISVVAAEDQKFPEHHGFDLEAIDMGRRGIHNDGSQTLMDRLSGKIKIDFDTARRLFTLVCVLYWRG